MGKTYRHVMGSILIILSIAYLFVFKKPMSGLIALAIGLWMVFKP